MAAPQDHQETDEFDREQQISLTIIDKISLPLSSINDRTAPEGVTVRCLRGLVLRDAIRQYLARYSNGRNIDIFSITALNDSNRILSMTSTLDRLANRGDSLTVCLVKTPWSWNYVVMRRVDEAMDNIRTLGLGYFCFVFFPTLTLGIILFATAFIVLYVVLFSHVVKQAVILDAGSSHTSVSKFSIFPQAVNSSDVIIKEDFGCEMSVQGISSFRHRPINVVPYLLENKCLRKALSYVNPSERKHAALVLGATGGIRTLKMTSPRATQEILGNVTWAFNYLGFSNVTEQVRILSGTEESLYAWVSVNYWSGSLESGHRMVGSLDWGGASSELTFPYEGQDFSDHVKSVNVFNDTIDVFSVSHECYGQQEALNRYFMGLISKEYYRTGSLNLYIRSPCHPRQIKPQVFSGFDLHGKCTEYKDKEFDLRIRDNPTLNFTFFGTGNVAECGRYIDEQFDYEKCSERYRSSGVCLDSEAIPKPPKNMTFYALSTYWYLVELFNLPSTEADTLDGLKMSREEFVRTSETACRSYDVEGMFLGWNLNRVHNACFRSLFMHKLLFDGYKFDSFEDITFANKINGNSVSWSLGYLLSISTKLPTSYAWAVPFEFIGVSIGCLLLGIIIATLIRYFGSRRLDFQRFF